MMHFSSHRTIFHNDILNELQVKASSESLATEVWLYAPFFGVPIGVYKLHHAPLSREVVHVPHR